MFHGVIPPMATPLLGSDELDLDGLQKLIDFQIAGGVSGLFILGTNGEAVSLSRARREELIAEACRIVDSRVPVLVGITHNALADAQALAAVAAQQGAAACVAALPSFYRLSQQEVVRYFRTLADTIELPLLLYNFPKMTKTAIEAETVAELAAHENIAGLKDSSGDMEHVGRAIELSRQAGPFCVMVGHEAQIPQAVGLGADGSICAGSNFLPRLFVDFYEAARDGDDAQVAKLVEIVDLVAKHVYDPPRALGMSITPGVKAALAALEICQPTLAAPLTTAPAEMQRQIAAGIREIERQLADL